MALKNALDPATVAPALSDWWRDAHPDASHVEVTGVEIPSSSGMSAETVLFDVSWTEDGADLDRRLVARVMPPGPGVFPDYDLAREAAAMDAVRTTTTIPAPEVVGVESAGVLPGPFLVMERLDGRTLSDDPPFTAEGWLLDLSDGERARIFDNGLTALAGIHRAGTDDLPPATLGHADDGDTLTQHLEHWESLYRWAGHGREHPVITAGLRWLTEHRPERTPAAGLSWGDARLGNLLFADDGTVTGALDWELCSIAPPELDLGWFITTNRMFTEAMGLPLPGGFLDPAATAARYEELAGRPLVDLPYYETFAAVRLAIVFLRLGTMMIDQGLLPADAGLPVNNPPSHLLAQHVGIEHETGEAGWVTGHR